MGLPSGPGTTSATAARSCRSAVDQSPDGVPAACGDLGTIYLPTDLDTDCYVNWGDFAVFASQWLWCTDPANGDCDQYWDAGQGGGNTIYTDDFNSHPVGKNDAALRLDSLMDEGGIQVCGNAQNCVTVCPKHIPLTTSIARAGRATSLRMLKRWFDL